MEMNSNKLEIESKCTGESSDITDICGEQQVLPRVGNEFQAEIPNLITESEYFQLLRNPVERKEIVNISHYFLMGLPILITWVSNEVKNPKKDQIVSKNSNNLNLTAEPKLGGNEYSVPGLLCDSWSDIEVESFLLGLYIFGKNLVQVKRFMENKEMGTLLSFYYGNFYKTKEHRRWADSRKMKRRRKCVIGPRLFNGWRQQELLSRLLPHVSEESKNALVEVTKTFAEGRSSLEEYASILKTTVGIQVLIEAIGIGKGKKDLTSIVMDPTKAQQVFSVRPEKACPSLTTEEIINRLTGDFRLSKTQSNNLFWEAVWPRLLARGWHSEQPNNQLYVGSKQCLVFLRPGIKKFSRRKLVKGDHYFDSVSEVLSKVASEPKLLDFEAEEDKASSSKEANGWGPDKKSDSDEPSDHNRPCYLKPRASNFNPSLIKFTIVDTSLGHGEKPSKIRELRSLPSMTKQATNPSTRSAESEENSSEDSIDEKKTSYLKGILDNVGSKKVVENHHDQSMITIKHQYSRRTKSGHSNHPGPATKRRRLTACTKADTNNSMKKQEELAVGSSAKNHLKEVEENVNPQPQSRPLIDLNQPQVQPDVCCKSSDIMEVDKTQDASNSIPNGSSCSSVKNEHMEHSDEIGNPNRRQSKRNRPLTAKALEALANGFLNMNRKGKGAAYHTKESLIPKPSRRARSRTTVIKGNSNELKGIDANTNMVTKPVIQTEIKVVDELMKISASLPVIANKG